MTRDDMDRVQADFVSATERAPRPRRRHPRTARRARLSAVELPVAADQSARRRIWRQPREPGALSARSVPRHPRRLAGRTSRSRCASPATTGIEGGNTPEDAAIFAAMFKDAGADMIDCSSGQVVKEEKPVYGRLFQTPFSDKIRNEIGIADHCRRRDLGGRPRQLDHRRRPRRSLRRRPSASGRSRPRHCTRRQRSAMPSRPGRSSITRPGRSMRPTSPAPPRQCSGRRGKACAGATPSSPAPAAASARPSPARWRQTAHRVSLCGRRAGPLEAVREEIASAGGEAVVLDGFDVTDAGRDRRRHRQARVERSATSPCWSTTPARRPSAPFEKTDLAMWSSVIAHQPDRRLPGHPGRACLACQARRQRPHRQRRQHRRPDRLCLRLGLLRRQAWRRRPDPRAGAGARRAPTSPSTRSAPASPTRRCSTAPSRPSSRKTGRTAEEARADARPRQSAGPAGDAAGGGRHRALARLGNGRPRSPARRSRSPAAK